MAAGERGKTQVISVDDPARWRGKTRLRLSSDDHVYLSSWLHPRTPVVRLRARRGDRYLAEPADSVAVAGCGSAHRGTAMATTATRDDLEGHAYPPRQLNLRGRAERPVETRYLLTRLADR